MELKDIIALSVGALLAVLFIIYILVNEKKNVLEWLKYAVSMAENELGKGTGQLKLTKVYDWFVEKFPVFSTILPFKIFSAWVDIALNTMNNWVNSRNNIGTYIETGEIKK